ncbi:protein DEHYDRATION-INDUCED 19 homolog 5 [Rhodamnia argentea]|uniref:Protein DEHYDRATION-INDUCED 19 homolog 5 n=1 Tax=Rhodamnia argentea TaxID=178133 RepID=A0A8B8Q9K6_9MYRT|nr:protein DEHYDRATION-INDUCED 19 homolog 5 [Rhodamnia argentea]
MEFDMWRFDLSASSRSHRSARKSRYDAAIVIDEFDGECDLEAYYPCPYCSDDYDLLELCLHIDEEHPVEADSGVCPVCATKVDTDMVEHITTKHSDILKWQQKLNLQKNESYSSFSSSRTEFGSVPSVVSSSNGPPDPFLSFIWNTPAAYESEKGQSTSPSASDIAERTPDEALSERDMNQSPMLEKDKIEKAGRCEFVQGLVMSSILDFDS